MRSTIFAILVIFTVGLLAFIEPGKKYNKVASTIMFDTTKPAIKLKSKTYSFTIEESGFKYLDSILIRANYFIGRRMEYEEGEILKQSMGVIISWFQQQKKLQDTVNKK